MAIKQCEHCGKPIVYPDTPALPNGLTSVCREWPEFCATIKTLKESNNIIARSIAEMRNGHPSPSKEFIEEHWLNCPDCRPRFEELLRQYPELFKLKGKPPADNRPFYAKENFGRK